MMRWILFLMVALLVCGCGKKRDKSEADMARLEHSDDRAEVEVMELREVPFRRQIATNGRLRAKNKSVLSFGAAGVVERIFVSNGQLVDKGAVLAELDKTDAQHSFNSATQALERAKIDLEDAVIGFGYDGVEATDIPENTMKLARIRSGYNAAELGLENALNALDNCTLRAPFAGRVADITGHLHERSGGDFCTLVDDSRLVVEFGVLETELDFAQKGNVVKVAPFFDPEKYVDGRIVSVNPLVDKNGQVLVEAEIANNGSFIDGMSVKLLVEKELPGQLVVPKSAVVMRDNLEILFRCRDGKAQWTYVHTVMDNSGEYVVAANTERGADLSVGDSIIVSGNLNLAHETPVSIKNTLNK